MRKKLFLIFLMFTFVLTCVAWGTKTPAQTTEADFEAFAEFEVELEDLRQKLKIPAFSAAIVRDQELVWAKGFGYANLGNKVEATPDTPYHLASLTKPFAATIIMQLVEEGVLNLDDPTWFRLLADPYICRWKDCNRGIKYIKRPFYNTHFYLESVSKNRPLSHIKHSPHSNHGYSYND